MDQPAAGVSAVQRTPSAVGAAGVPPATGATGVVPRPDTAPALTADSLSISVDVESHHGATCNVILHLHSDGGRRKKQIKFPVDFKSDTSMSLAAELVQSLGLPDGERMQLRIASAMEAKIQPVRKQYFAQIIAEETAGRETTEAHFAPTRHYSEGMEHAASAGHGSGMNHPSTQQQHQPRSNLNRYASFPSAGGDSRPATSDAHSGMQHPGPSVTSQPRLTGLPSHQQQNHTGGGNKQTPPNPQQHTAPSNGHPAGKPDSISPQKAHTLPRTVSQPATVQSHQPAHMQGGTLPPPQFEVRAASQTPQSGPQRSATAMANMFSANGGAGGTNGMPTRPGTAQGNRSSLPLNLGAIQQAHGNPPKQTHSSLPLNDPFAADYARAQSMASQQQAAIAQAQAQSQRDPRTSGHGVAPPQSPPLGPIRTTSTQAAAPPAATSPCAACASGLLTLADFDSSEAYDAYLLGEISALSVGQLKERLRAKPGGSDLLKACFEKQDMVQLLIRIMGQEACTQNPTLACGHCGGNDTKQSQQPPQSQQQQSTSAHFSHLTAVVSPHPHTSFSGNPSSAETPDFLSPEPTGRDSATPAASPISRIHKSVSVSTTHASGGGGLQPSPDPWDVLMGTPSPNTSEPVNTAADHRLTHQQHQQSQPHHHHQHHSSHHQQEESYATAVTKPHRHSDHVPSSTTSSSRRAHHVHHSLDSGASPNSTSNPLSAGVAISTDFPFSPHGPFSNHSGSEAGSTRSVGTPNTGAVHSPALDDATAADDDQPQQHHHHHHHHHPHHLQRSPSSPEDTSSGTFEFQVSITTPTQSQPDMGLDGHTEEPVDFLSPPTSATNAQQHQQGKIASHTSPMPSRSLQDGRSGDSEEPLSAPHHHVDLLTSSGHTSSNSNTGTAQPPRHARQNSVGRVRLAPSLGGVLEDDAAEQTHDHTGEGAPRGVTGQHRLDERNASSNGDGVSKSPNSQIGSPSKQHRHSTSPHGRQPSLDPELNAFFTQARTTDLLVPNSGHHLIPGSAALQQHHEKQRAIASTKTAPSNLLADIFAQAQANNQQQHRKNELPTTTRQASADAAAVSVSAMGTKPSRSYTTPDVTTFDPLFFSNQSSDGNTTNQPHHSTQQHQQQQTSHAGTTKSQRTKSEADQSSQDHGFQI